MPLPILACGTKAYRQSVASTRFKALAEVTRTSVERGATPLSTHDPAGTPKILAAQHFWREFRGQQNALASIACPVMTRRGVTPRDRARVCGSPRCCITSPRSNFALERDTAPGIDGVAWQA